MMAAPRTNGTPTCLMLTIGLAGLFVANAFAFNALLWLFTPPALGGTVLDHTWAFLKGHSLNDSWWPMGEALTYFQTQYRTGLSSIPMYTEIVANRRIKFQYPPSSLLALLWLGIQGHATYLRDFLMWVFVILTALSTAILLEWRLRYVVVAPPSSRPLLWLRTIIVIGVALTFYPVVKAYTLGQIQVWINGLFALAVLCWVLGQKAPAGILVGLMALIKPHYGVFFLWAFLRREWRFMLPGLAVAGAGGCLALLIFGWENHIDYLRILAHIGSRGEAFYPNQSVNGLLNRLLSIADPLNYNNLKWRNDWFPPFNASVYVGTLASSMLFLGLALLRSRRADDHDGALDFCTVAVACTLASPIAWEHHYGILLPVFVILLASRICHGRQLIWLGAAFTLASNFIPATNMLAQTPLNAVQSYLLGAAVIVFLLLNSKLDAAVTRARFT